MSDPRYLWALCASVLAAGCVSDASAMSERRAQALLVVTESGPNSLDIHGVGANRQTYGLAWNVYDRLLSYGVKQGPGGVQMYDYRQLEPELAERWERVQGALVFHLRRDARFHDGTPVTAHDVKWSFDRAVTVGGFPTFQMKAGSLEKPEQFEVVDEHTFRIRLLREDKLTLPDLAVPVPVVINRKLALAHATPADPWAMKWLKTHTAAGGAYRIASWRPGQQTVYERNDAWRSGPLPKLKRVVVREVPSASAQLALLSRGDADVVVGLAPHDLAQLKASAARPGGGVKVLGVPVENALTYLGMNVTKPPFNDVRVRRAVAYAVPYERIMRAAMFGRGVPMYGADPSARSAVWPTPSPYRTDLARAKQLLREAGYADGFETTLSFDQGFATTNEPIALLVQEALLQVGVRASLNKIPGAGWRGALLKKDLPFVLNSFGGWLNYPEYFFFWAYHGQNAVFNTMSYQNPELDAQVELARFETDPARYAAEVQRFVQIAFDQAPRVPLFQPLQDVAMRDGVHGYSYWFHRQLDFRRLHKEAP